MQLELDLDIRDLMGNRVRPVHHIKPKGSLLKWIGNKYRMAEQIASYFPYDANRYFDVFLGSGAILATIAPNKGVGSDSFGPLIEIWIAVQKTPDQVKEWYKSRWLYAIEGDKRTKYEDIKASYNKSPNGADFLFLVRSCYGGVVRFRKSDGYMSTPVGAHRPISPAAFSERVDEWHNRLQGIKFHHADYADVMATTKPGDFVYCDPPYYDSQPILYGAQEFDLAELIGKIDDCKKRGVKVALSIDGTKKSGKRVCEIPFPDGLFEREVSIEVGRSMLRRFQMSGETLESELVADRLLLTY